MDLRKEKIEWVEDPVRSFRRLRRKLGTGAVEEAEKKASDDGSGGDGDDDSADEDWGKSAGKEMVDVDGDDSESLELEEDEEEIGSAKRRQVGNLGSRKRKVIEPKMSGSGKKSKCGGIGEMLGLKVSPGKSVEPAINVGSK